MSYTRLEQALKNVVGKVRIDSGQSGKTALVIVAAQSVQNTDTTEQKGFDSDKKVPGIKRHIAVDTQWLPHTIAITTTKVAKRNELHILAVTPKR